MKTLIKIRPYLCLAIGLMFLVGFAILLSSPATIGKCYGYDIVYPGLLLIFGGNDDVLIKGSYMDSTSTFKGITGENANLSFTALLGFILVLVLIALITVTFNNDLHKKEIKRPLIIIVFVIGLLASFLILMSGITFKAANQEAMKLNDTMVMTSSWITSAVLVDIGSLLYGLLYVLTTLKPSEKK